MVIRVRDHKGVRVPHYNIAKDCCYKGFRLHSSCYKIKGEGLYRLGSHGYNSDALRIMVRG